MSKLCSIIALFACFYIINATDKTDYKTCSTHGITHFRGFSTTDYVVPCFQPGGKVLVQNQWVKVTSHTYLNETNSEYDWRSSKIFIEIFADLPDVPVALVSSDMFLSNCTTGCLVQTGKTSLGINNDIEVTFKGDKDSTVMYIYYRRADITMYLRKGMKTFNFGIRLPSIMSQFSSGMCVTACPKNTVHQFDNCLKGETLAKVNEICKLLFTDIKPDNNIDIAVLACSHDMVLWGDVLVGLDDRNTYIDELMIEDYDTIDSRYIFGKISKTSLLEYQEVINKIDCDSDSAKPAIQAKQ